MLEGTILPDPVLVLPNSYIGQFFSDVTDERLTSADNQNTVARKRLLRPLVVLDVGAKCTKTKLKKCRPNFLGRRPYNFTGLPFDPFLSCETCVVNMKLRLLAFS